MTTTTTFSTSVLDLKPLPAVIGAVVGAAALVIPRAVAGSAGLLMLLAVYTLIVLVGYLVASFTIGDTVGEICRGVLLGATAAMNWAVASVLFPKVFGAAAGSILAIVAGVYPFLAVFPFISRFGLYSGLLGYLNWLLPMSWPIVALGFLFFIGGALGALIGLAGADFFKIERIIFHWQTGTLFTRGGWISNLNPIDTAFNMATFAFVDVKYTGMAIEHETGHTLNLGAFGSLFHLIGAFDENVITKQFAFSERLAESHVPATPGPALAMWL